MMCTTKGVWHEETGKNNTAFQFKITSLPPVADPETQIHSPLKVIHRGTAGWLGQLGV